MLPETIHIHKSSLHKNTNIILLLIPIIVFGLILILYLISVRNGYIRQFAAKSGEDFVLGKTSNLDNNSK